MHRLRRPLLAALLLVLALPAAASAAADRRYAVTLTGIHVLDWKYASLDYPDRCKQWSEGSGQQTLGFSTPKAMTFKGSGSDPREFTFYPDTSRSWNEAIKVTATRKGEWTAHKIPPNCTPCGDLSEYGPCPPDEDDLLAPLFVCGTKKLKPGSVSADYGGGKLEALLQLPPVDDPPPFTNCPPNVGRGSLAKFQQANPLPVLFSGEAVASLPKLARGRRLTLKGSAEQGYALPKGDYPGDCRKAKAKADRGYWECATTDLTLQIRRTR